MSGPGGGFGEGAHGDAPNTPPGSGRGPEQPGWTPPWDPPPPDNPPPAYSPQGYPPGHPADYPPGHPVDYPPGYPADYPPPPGYGPPQGYAPPPGYGPPQGYAPPPGYGPPSYPGGYYATDYQGQAGTNGLAIASLISSFTGFFCCFIGSIAAIVLGAVALRQIRETRQDGHGLAVAGIAIGVGTLAVFVIVALFSIVPANSH
jgi:hypothetical protein